MSDMRAKIALSSVIATIVMVVGLFSFAPITSGIQADSVSSTGSAMALVGHFTLTISDPDGFVKYYGQFDNAVLENTKECMMDTITATTRGVNCADVTKIVLGGDSTGGFNENTGMVDEYTNTNANRANFVENRDPVGINNAGADFAEDFTFDILDTPANNAGCVADTDGDGLQECDIKEVGIQTAAGDTVARAGPTVVPTAEPGDTINATYDVDLQ